jgi:hypothetical protein
MRRLWEDHITWTRLAVISLTTDSPDNPHHWRIEVMQAELRTNLNLTTDEVVARLEGDWAADVAAYDKIHDHALHLSDLLSDGLIKQFPKCFRSQR